MSLYLEIKTSTWLRDTHGLYDYDTSYTVEENLKITESGSIIRRGNEICYFSEVLSLSEENLLNIHEDHNGFLLYPSKQHSLGLVVKELKNHNKGYELLVGDVLKLGKVVLKVIETSKVEESEKYDDCEGRNLSDNTCRICFRTHSNPFDPLLSLCKCSGTMGLTHLNCLQK